MGFSAGFVIRKGFLVWVPEWVPDHLPDPPAFLVTTVCPRRSMLTSGRHWWWIGNHSSVMALQRKMDQKGSKCPKCISQGLDHIFTCVGRYRERHSEDPDCVRVHHGIGEHEVVQAVCIAYQMADGGQDTPHGAPLCVACGMRQHRFPRNRYLSLHHVCVWQVCQV